MDKFNKNYVDIRKIFCFFLLIKEPKLMWTSVLFNIQLLLTLKHLRIKFQLTLSTGTLAHLR